ncbi:MAG TPA: amino-acid N-acetyltransferase [Burkholderiales bacterium]|nr:amino-acid N-acetyltransferase [Burkholderiales bacterium]
MATNTKNTAAKANAKQGGASETFDARFLTWFRAVAPYFHAFRNKVFVIAFGGEAVADNKFALLANDINLLYAAGIRLILVHGSKPQIAAQLKQRHAKARFLDGVRITNDVALACVKEAVGLLRVEIDAWLSQGLPNSPMAGAVINTVSGNFITAQPYGIREGVDYQYTGTVRKVDTGAIAGCLAANNIVIVSNVGYSPTGEVFNCAMEDVAVAIARGMNAEKLIFLTDEPVVDEKGELVTELSADAAAELLASPHRLTSDTQLYLEHAMEAVRGEVSRAHLISYHVDGALLIELFTHDGSGTLVTRTGVERLRRATIDDVGGILQLIEPLEADGTLVYRGRELLEREVDRFFVIEHDKVIVGCAALYPFAKGRMAELAALAVRPDFRRAGYGEKLLDALTAEAKRRGMKKLMVLTTVTAQWFIERGFTLGGVKALPEPRRSLYNWQRRSKVLVKNL